MRGPRPRHRPRPRAARVGRGRDRGHAVQPQPGCGLTRPGRGRASPHSSAAWQRTRRARRRRPPAGVFTDDGAHVVTAAKEGRPAAARPSSAHRRRARARHRRAHLDGVDDRHVPLTGDTRPRRPRPHAVHPASYLGLHRAHGLRLFVEAQSPTGWALLEVPERLERRAPAVPVVVCRGLGDGRGGLHRAHRSPRARSRGAVARWHAASGAPRRARRPRRRRRPGPGSAVGHGRADSVRVAAAEPRARSCRSRFAGGLESVDSDAPLFADSRSRALPWLALTAQASPAFAVRLTATPAGASAEDRPDPGQHLAEAWEATVPRGIRLGAPGAGSGR